MFLTEPKVYELLSAFKISVPRYKVFHYPRLPENWREFPAVVKIVSGRFIHKSEVGGVAVVGTFQELKDYTKTISEKLNVKSFIIEEKLSGIEAFVGIKRDRSFGHVIGVGIGGELVELVNDITFFPLDSTKDDILKALRRTKLYRLLSGFRKKQGNLELFIEFLIKLNKFINQNPEIEELDLNPVFISDNRICPGDGRAVTSLPKGKKKTFKPLNPKIFQPRSIAVIGASENPQKVGHGILRNLLNFKGRLFPVNPNYDKIFGIPCFPSIKEIPEIVDCAVIAVPAPKVPKILEECGEKGVTLAVIISAGFSESGVEGKELQETVEKIAKTYNIRILGPNTLGFIVPHLNLNASFSVTTPPKGELAFLSQSGALITTVIDRAISENIGFSLIVSLGNQADIEITEVLDITVKDKETKTILAYIEGTEQGTELSKLVAKKTAILIKAGRREAGKKAAASHTGSIAGNYKVFHDVLELKGAIIVNSLEEAFECAEFSLSYGRLSGNRVLIITNAGGPGTLAADYVIEFGLKLADITPVIQKLSELLPPNWSKLNPIDILGDATSHRYQNVFSCLSEYQDWDTSLIIVTPQSMTDIPGITREIIHFKEKAQKPIVACLMGGHSIRTGVEILRKNGIPVYKDPYIAINVLRRMLWERT